MTRSVRLVVRAAACVACGAGPGLAAPAWAEGRQPLWELGMGAAVLQLPHYRGSDQQHTWLLPAPYVVYRGQLFKADREGARAELLAREALRLDLSVGASAPTRSRENRAREGMPDLAPTVEIGPNLNWTLQQGPGWKLDLRLPLRAALTVSREPRWLGWLAAPHLNLDRRLASGWNLGLQGGPVWQGRGLAEHFYGVPPEYARAGRPAYQAAGGAAGWTALSALSRRDGRRWMGAFIKFDSLDGASFGASPLLRQRQQWSGGVAVSWVFAQSASQVEAAP
ncbi:MipA/OmpV family protein [Aquabacterium sp. OR-4]|uniref:MipA/OmpV family protein n=1 Tax=Aquabacterium sp. OR-4 TaxID=2978127 RepID=UPI0021B228B2|nr:MipA/OmpV family protein [Aquabacterium sp. OR-4]MDT7836754.1 MipA/OmpV family protein [Aquabacterium sp. OR-4]